MLERNFMYLMIYLKIKNQKIHTCHKVTKTNYDMEFKNFKFIKI
jgi:hypothetical protein